MRRAVSLACAFALAGCSYDWEVGAPGAEAGPRDTASADAGFSDALFSDAVSADAFASDALAADGSGPADTGCEALEAMVDADRKAARMCQIGSGECAMTVKDACGCDVFVAVGSSAAAQSFAASSSALAHSSCALQCSACPSLPTSGTCLDMMGAYACWP